MEGTAVCKEPRMRSGKHYVEFTLVKGTNCTIGVCKAEFDPEDRKLACATADGWGYSARLGNLHHNTLRPTTRWTGQKAAREGNVIGMLLNMDLGSLTVYHDGVKTGELVRSGLPKYDSLIWMVQLTDGAEVRIAKKDPPSSSRRDLSAYSSSYRGPESSGKERVRQYMKRVGLDAWYNYFETHLPANMKSVRLVRATTSADLRRMATKANMRLDAATTTQVLNALKKAPTEAELADDTGSSSRGRAVSKEEVTAEVNAVGDMIREAKAAGTFVSRKDSLLADVRSAVEAS